MARAKQIISKAHSCQNLWYYQQKGEKGRVIKRDGTDWKRYQDTQ